MKLQARTDAGALINSVDLPDAMVSRARAAFGVPPAFTNQEAAEFILKRLRRWLDRYIESHVGNTAATAAEASVVPAKEQAVADYRLEVPEFVD